MDADTPPSSPSPKTKTRAKSLLAALLKLIAMIVRFFEQRKSDLLKLVRVQAEGEKGKGKGKQKAVMACEGKGEGDEGMAAKKGGDEENEEVLKVVCQRKFTDGFWLIETRVEDNRDVLFDNFGDKEPLDVAIVKNRKVSEHGWEMAPAMNRIVREGDGYSVMTRKVLGRKRGDEVQLFQPEEELVKSVEEMAWFMETKEGLAVYREGEESPTDKCIASLKRAIATWETTHAIPAPCIVLAGAGVPNQKHLRMALMILDEKDFLRSLAANKPQYTKDKKGYPLCGTYYRGTVTRHIGTKKFRSLFTTAPAYDLVDPIFFNESSATADTAALVVAKKKKEELRKKESKARKKARKAAEAAEEKACAETKREGMDEGRYSSSNQEIREKKSGGDLRKGQTEVYDLGNEEAVERFDEAIRAGGTVLVLRPTGIERV